MKHKDWNIHKFDPVTRTAYMKHKDGDETSIAIPDTHVSSEDTHNLMKAHIDAYVRPDNAEIKATVADLKEVKRTELIMKVVIGIQAVLLALLIAKVI